MIDEAAELAHAKLMNDLIGAQRLCRWLADLLGTISEAGTREGLFNLEDTLGAASRIARLIFWSIEETERAVASGKQNVVGPNGRAIFVTQANAL